MTCRRRFSALLLYKSPPRACWPAIGRGPGMRRPQARYLPACHAPRVGGGATVARRRPSDEAEKWMSVGRQCSSVCACEVILPYCLGFQSSACQRRRKCGFAGCAFRKTCRCRLVPPWTNVSALMDK